MENNEISYTIGKDEDYNVLKTTPLTSFVLLLVIVLSATHLLDTFITQRLTMDAIKDCSGSPSCIESTASVLLYKSTPCLDGYKYNKNP